MASIDRLLPSTLTPWASKESRAVFGAFADQARRGSYGDKIDKLASAKKILAAPPRQQAEIATLAVAFIDAHLASRMTGRTITLDMGDSMVAELSKSLVSKLVQKPLPWTPDELVRMVDVVAERPHWVPGAGILRAVSRAHDAEPVPAPLHEALRRLREVANDAMYKELRTLAAKVDEILAGPGAAPAAPASIKPVDAWTVALGKAMERLKPKERAAVEALIAHAAKATTAQPGKAWLARARELVAALGGKTHTALLNQLVGAVGTPAPFPIEVRIYGGDIVARSSPLLVHEDHSNTLRGMIWTAMVGDTAALIGAIGDCAERCFKKLPGHGPLQPKIGNACLQVLSHAPSDDAVGQLSRLKARAKHPSVRKLLDKAVAGAGERTGRTPEELEEIGVPTCGLDEIGRRVVRFGKITAELRVAADAELVWRDAAGKVLRAPPASVPRDDVAALKRQHKELAVMLPGQRVRLERMLLGGRTLPHADWRTRYADHPLVGALARRLVWWCDDKLVGLDGDRLVDVDGKRVTRAGAMRLWHPLESPAKVVQAWRARLAEVTQPFKQAHREIYVLTDAERRTAVYSNRFAAHILRQHQFAALCQQRGWRYKLQGAWDSHNTPYLEMPQHGWRVELWVDPGHDQDPHENAIYPLVVTDKVQFMRLGDHVPAPLTEVPPLVFSEGMRDVDLFVGVTSVGNDPNWEDSGERVYWNRFAFGELGVSAAARREVLARLVPRLAIADRCELGERFLTVRGQRRTYQIHLGSAAVQMAVNSQYLCIVPARGAADQIMLPFEGDRTLSLILSKAFLLAADDQIRDPGIRRQIGMED